MTKFNLGFDMELLLGEEYLQYLILSSVDTGLFDTKQLLTVTLQGEPYAIHVNLKVPEEIRRNYQVNPNAQLPMATPLDTFAVSIIDDESNTDLEIKFIADVMSHGAFSLDLRDVELIITARFDLLEQRNAETAALEDVVIAFELLTLRSTDDALEPIIDSYQTAIVALLSAEFSNVIGGSLFPSVQGIQGVRTRKFTSDPEKRAFGIYLNLVIRTGSEPAAVLPFRGDTTIAINFLDVGMDMAFGISPLLFRRLESHLQFEFASVSATGTGPLEVRDGDVLVGTLKKLELDVTKSRYQLFDLSQSELTTCLRLKVKIESVYAGADVLVTLEFFPVVTDGLLGWEMASDIDVDILFEALPAITLVTLGLLGGVPGLIFGGIIGGSLFILQEQVLEPFVEGLIGEDAETKADTTQDIFDLIPQRISLSNFRWDPFYATDHQLLVPFDFFVLEDEGLACCGKVQLANEPMPYDPTILRDVGRNTESSAIENYQYRIRDHTNHRVGYLLQFPASDRDSFEESSEEEETDLLLLTPSQLDRRLASGKIKSRISYRAHMVDIEENHVSRIATMSVEELMEGEVILRARYLEEEVARLIAEGGEDIWRKATERALANGEIDPDEATIYSYARGVIAASVNQRVSDRVENSLKDDLVFYMRENYRLDLSPHEYGSLQRNYYAIGIQWYELIEREGRYYYRDKPDGLESNNLMSLPRIPS